jgi:hypothetical protein
MAVSGLHGASYLPNEIIAYIGHFVKPPRCEHYGSCADQHLGDACCICNRDEGSWVEPLCDRCVEWIQIDRIQALERRSSEKVTPVRNAPISSVDPPTIADSWYNSPGVAANRGSRNISAPQFYEPGADAIRPSLRRRRN